MEKLKKILYLISTPLGIIGIFNIATASYMNRMLGYGYVKMGYIAFFTTGAILAPLGFNLSDESIHSTVSIINFFINILILLPIITWYLKREDKRLK